MVLSLGHSENATTLSTFSYTHLIFIKYAHAPEFVCYNLFIQMVVLQSVVFIGGVMCLVPGFSLWQLAVRLAVEAGNHPEHMNYCLWPEKQ